MAVNVLCRAAVSLAILCIFASHPLRAEAPQAGSHGAWGVFEDGTGADRLCWVAASAELGSLPPDGATMPATRILILFTPSKDQYSLELRGDPTPDAPGDISLGDRRFAIFFQDGWGWLQDKGADAAVRELMENRRTAWIRIGEAGYSVALEGFVPAVRAARALCR